LADVAGAALTPTPDHPDPGVLAGRNPHRDRDDRRAAQVTTTRALLVLRAAAFTSNRAITDAADDVLAGRITFSVRGPVET
jgi:hypothetical protein